MLSREARKALRGLTKDNAETVGRHLVMAGRLIDVDPELAWEHAQAAGRRAARIDVVREALALTAHASGRYAEALREIRTARRLSGVDAYATLEADSERGLGRPERALDVIRAARPRVTTLELAELAVVEAAARVDLGEAEAALILLDELDVPEGLPDLPGRVREVRELALRALGRNAEADALPQDEDEPAAELDEDPIVVFDLDEDPDEPAVDGEPAVEKAERAAEEVDRRGGSTAAAAGAAQAIAIADLAAEVGAELAEIESVEAAATLDEQVLEELDPAEPESDPTGAEDTEPRAEEGAEPEIASAAEGGSEGEGDEEADAAPEPAAHDVDEVEDEAAEDVSLDAEISTDAESDVDAEAAAADAEADDASEDEPDADTLGAEATDDDTSDDDTDGMLF